MRQARSRMVQKVLDLGLATVELVGELQTAGEVIASQLKRLNPALF